MKRSLQLRTYRVGTPRQPGEGLRIGTVRHLPRGVKKGDYARRDYFDVWLPALAPSRTLLGWAREQGLVEHWPTFAKRYEREMAQTDSHQTLLLLAHLARETPVSIGCYCEDESHCHRSLLFKLIKQAAA